MAHDPLDDAVARIAASEDAAQARGSAADQELRQLLTSFADRMSKHRSVPFLRASATTSTVDRVLAHGWCVRGLMMSVRTPRDRGEATGRYPDDYDVRERYGLGVCADGTPVRLNLGPPHLAADPHRWDAYVAAGGWDVVTCESLSGFHGFGSDPQAIITGVTAALAGTLVFCEREGDEVRVSEEPFAVLAELRLKRTHQWRDWEAQVRAALAAVDDPVERYMRLVGSFGGVPARLADLVPAGTSDRTRLVTWFLRSATTSPTPQRVQRVIPGGFIRGTRIKESDEPGWEFRNGSTEPRSQGSLTDHKTIVLLADGELRHDRAEAGPDVGFNSDALREMAWITAMAKLPASPDTGTAIYRDRFGHKSVRYADGTLTGGDEG